MVNNSHKSMGVIYFFFSKNLLTFYVLQYIIYIKIKNIGGKKYEEFKKITG